MDAVRERTLPHPHAVAFYDSELDLVVRLAGFVAEGLAADEAVVVLATAEHRAALEQVLAQGGLHVRADSRFIALDAAQTLDSLLVDGRLDPELVRVAATGVVERATAGGRTVRVFGEMVALLWDRGDRGGALALEGIWSVLAARLQFSLLCAYPTSVVDGGLVPLGDLCGEHTDVHGPPSYGVGLDVLGLPAGLGRAQTFLPVVDAIAVTRRFVGCTLRSWRRDDLADDARLVVSELATNAVRHGRSPFRVSVLPAAGGVRIEVEDLSDGRPQQQPPSLGRSSGRGIALVHAVSARWGVEPGDGGKVVWAELSGSRQELSPPP